MVFCFALLYFTKSGNSVNLVIENRIQHVTSSSLHYLSHGMEDFSSVTLYFPKEGIKELNLPAWWVSI